MTGPTQTFHINAENPSESASLKGHKAKTPIIAGSICGALLGIAWIIGLTVYFITRRKRKAREARVAAGLEPPKEPKKPERYIIPPDPAIVQGQQMPGQYVLGGSTNDANLKLGTSYFLGEDPKF